MSNYLGKEIEYGEHFKYMPECTLVSQFDFGKRYAFYMETEEDLPMWEARVAVWRVKTPKIHTPCQTAN